MTDLDRAEQLADQLATIVGPQLGTDAADMLTALVARVRELEQQSERRWHALSHVTNAVWARDCAPDVLDRAHQLALEVLDEDLPTVADLVGSDPGFRTIEDAQNEVAWMVREAEWVRVVSEQAGRVRALTDAGNTVEAAAEEYREWAMRGDNPSRYIAASNALADALAAWRALVDTAPSPTTTNTPPEAAQSRSKPSEPETEEAEA